MTSSPDSVAMKGESAPVPDQAPAEEQVAAPFRQSKICICVDVSGSTYGPALTAEIKAVKQVCSLIPRSMHENITIIPWNDASERPRPLSQIHTLESGGGTDPNVLLEDPLTMGNYPETDIISDTIVCGKCAVAMVGTRRIAHKETLVAALPLVSYSKNQDAWLQTVNIATGRRFHRSDLAQVFLSIIFTKIERLLSESSKVPNLHNALNWQATMIQSEVILQSETFPHVCQLGVGLINEVILRNYRDCLLHDKFPLILSYPLDGFIVTNAALSNSKYSGILSQPKRKAVVLLRFLYHLLENCCAYEQENGPLQLHAAKTLILLMDDPSGPRSLFKWRSLRAFSFRFDSLQDLQKYLSNHAVMDRYRLSLKAADLLDTPLLTATSLAAFRRLGPLFSWIEREAGNAIAVFVHYLMRLETGPCLPSVLFQRLREREELKEALADPGALSARAVERLIKPLTVLQ
ncbi:hypothetical protein H9Q69_009681 [Fusarium xylarioides]|nr:hypothetical protein H9Q69_009681 [Fusarium xylarioides]